MGRRNPRFAAYVAVVATAAAAGCYLSWAAGYGVQLSVQMISLAVAVVVTEVAAVELPGGHVMSLTYPLSVCAVVLLGPTAGAILAGVSMLPSTFARPRMQPLRLVFNLGQVTLSTLLTGWAYLALGGRVLLGHPLTASDFPWMAAPVCAVAVVGLLANFLLIGLAFLIEQHVRFGQVWRSVMSWMFASQVALGLLGVAIAQVMAVVGVAALVLSVTPLLVARQVYQRYLTLREAYADTVKSLVGAIEAKDPYTKGHSVRVSQYVVAISRQLGCREEATDRLERAALLHDLGKVAVSRAILVKETKLTEAEFGQIRKHPDIAARILESAPHLLDIVPVVRYHHERYDGGGYGAGLAGEDIPFDARVLAVADSFDAMTSDRAYRSALSLDEAVKELRRCAGAQFDQSVVEAMIAALPVQDDCGRGPTT